MATYEIEYKEFNPCISPALAMVFYTKFPFGIIIDFMVIEQLILNKKIYIMKTKFLFLLCLIMVGLSLSTTAQYKKHYYKKNNKKYYYTTRYSPSKHRYVRTHYYYAPAHRSYVRVPLPPAPRVVRLPLPPRPVILVPPPPPRPRIRH